MANLFIHVAFASLVGVGILIPSIADEAATLEWHLLPDPASQNYEDPYRGINQDLLADVIEVASLRIAQALPGTLDSNDAVRLEALLDNLKDKGIDADWLISQRWIVAERREMAFSKGNTAINGTNVILSGFAIPAPADDDGTSIIYLVQLPGLCSHMRPPPPNLLIRVRLAENWSPTYLHQPVRVTGRIQIDPTKKIIRVIDGDVSMNATWRLDATRIEDFRPNPGAMSEKAEWVERIRGSVKASQTHADQ